MVRYTETYKKADSTSVGPFSIIALILLIFELLILLFTVLGLFNIDNQYIVFICNFPWIIISLIFAIISTKTRQDSLGKILIKVNFFILIFAVVLILVMSTLFKKPFTGTFQFLHDEISPVLWGN